MAEVRVGGDRDVEAWERGLERMSARMRQAREASGLTQAQVAERSGIIRPNVARLENGHYPRKTGRARVTPSLWSLARYASAVGVPLSHLVEALDDVPLGRRP